MINFQETQLALERFQIKLQALEIELQQLRTEHLQANLELLQAQENARRVAIEENIMVSKRGDYIKSESYIETRLETTLKAKLKAKEEVKELTIEGLNLLKFQIKLKELEYKLTNNQV